MNAYLLCINLCFILITQIIRSNNNPNNDLSTLMWVCNEIYSTGKGCVEGAKGACKFLVDHGKGQAAIERLPKLEAKLEHQDQQREETEKKNHAEQAEQQKQTNANQEKIIKALEPTKLEQAAQVATIVHTTLEVGGVVYKAADGIYHYYNPTQDAKTRDEQLKFEADMYRNARRRLNAQHSLRHCLAFNDDAPKDAEGLPRICAQQFKEFAAVATRKEVDEMKDDFRQR